ncbi:MAG: hypothetical protein ACTSV5_00855 [Promethearchaeota archaeon]
MTAEIPFLVTLVYLSIYHHRWVNNVVIKVSEFMELGTLNIKSPVLTNLKYFKHPEMLDLKEGFFKRFMEKKSSSY